MAVVCPKWGCRYSHVELTEAEAEVSNDTPLASATIGKLLGAEPKYAVGADDAKAACCDSVG